MLVLIYYIDWSNDLLCWQRLGPRRCYHQKYHRSALSWYDYNITPFARTGFTFAYSIGVSELKRYAPTFPFQVTMVPLEVSWMTLMKASCLHSSLTCTLNGTILTTENSCGQLNAPNCNALSTPQKQDPLACNAAGGSLRTNNGSTWNCLICPFQLTEGTCRALLVSYLNIVVY